MTRWLSVGASSERWCGHRGAMAWTPNQRHLDVVPAGAPVAIEIEEDDEPALLQVTGEVFEFSSGDAPDPFANDALDQALAQQQLTHNDNMEISDNEELEGADSPMQTDPISNPSEEPVPLYISGDNPPIPDPSKSSLSSHAINEARIASNNSKNRESVSHAELRAQTRPAPCRCGQLAKYKCDGCVRSFCKLCIHAHPAQCTSPIEEFSFHDVEGRIGWKRCTGSEFLPTRQLFCSKAIPDTHFHYVNVGAFLLHYPQYQDIFCDMETVSEENWKGIISSVNQDDDQNFIANVESGAEKIECNADSLSVELEDIMLFLARANNMKLPDLIRSEPIVVRDWAECCRSSNYTGIIERTDRYWKLAQIQAICCNHGKQNKIIECILASEDQRTVKLRYCDDGCDLNIQTCERSPFRPTTTTSGFRTMISKSLLSTLGEQNHTVPLSTQYARLESVNSSHGKKVRSQETIRKAVKEAKKVDDMKEMCFGVFEPWGCSACVDLKACIDSGVLCRQLRISSEDACHGVTRNKKSGTADQRDPELFGRYFYPDSRLDPIAAAIEGESPPKTSKSYCPSHSDNPRGKKREEKLDVCYTAGMTCCCGLWCMGYFGHTAGEGHAKATALTVAMAEDGTIIDRSSSDVGCIRCHFICNRLPKLISKMEEIENAIASNEEDAITEELAEGLGLTMQEILDIQNLPPKSCFAEAQRLAQCMVVPEIHFWFHQPGCRYCRGDRFVQGIGRPFLENIEKFWSQLQKAAPQLQRMKWADFVDHLTLLISKLNRDADLSNGKRFVQKHCTAEHLSQVYEDDFDELYALYEGVFEADDDRKLSKDEIKQKSVYSMYLMSHENVIGDPKKEYARRIGAIFLASGKFERLKDVEELVENNAGSLQDLYHRISQDEDPNAILLPPAEMDTISFDFEYISCLLQLQASTCSPKGLSKKLIKFLEVNPSPISASVWQEHVGKLTKPERLEELDLVRQPIELLTEDGLVFPQYEALVNNALEYSKQMKIDKLFDLVMRFMEISRKIRFHIIKSSYATKAKLEKDALKQDIQRLTKGVNAILKHMHGSNAELLDSKVMLKSTDAELASIQFGDQMSISEWKLKLIWEKARSYREEIGIQKAQIQRWLGFQQFQVQRGLEACVTSLKNLVESNSKIEIEDGFGAIRAIVDRILDLHMPAMRAVVCNANCPVGCQIEFAINPDCMQLISDCFRGYWNGSWDQCKELEFEIDVVWGGSVKPAKVELARGSILVQQPLPEISAATISQYELPGGKSACISCCMVFSRIWLEDSSQFTTKMQLGELVNFLTEIVKEGVENHRDFMIRQNKPVQEYPTIRQISTDHDSISASFEASGKILPRGTGYVKVNPLEDLAGLPQLLDILMERFGQGFSFLINAHEYVSTFAFCGNQQVIYFDSHKRNTHSIDGDLAVPEGKAVLLSLSYQVFKSYMVKLLEREQGIHPVEVWRLELATE